MQKIQIQQMESVWYLNMEGLRRTEKFPFWHL